MPRIDLQEVMSAIEDKPFTFLLLMLGAVLGYLLPGGFDYFFQISITEVIKNPNTLSEYIIGIPIALFVETTSSIIGGIIGTIIGLLIDWARDSGLQ